MGEALAPPYPCLHAAFTGIPPPPRPLTSHNRLIPSHYPDPHTDRSTALMEVAKCSPDLTVQSSVRDPEVTGEAVKLRVTSFLAQ